MDLGFSVLSSNINIIELYDNSQYLSILEFANLYKQKFGVVVLICRGGYDLLKCLGKIEKETINKGVIIIHDIYYNMGRNNYLLSNDEQNKNEKKYNFLNIEYINPTNIFFINNKNYTIDNIKNILNIKLRVVKFTKIKNKIHGKNK